MLRIVRLSPDLRVLLSGVGRSIPPLFAIGLATGMLLFVYGMVGWTLFGDELPEQWGNIGRAMLTLFVMLTLENFPTYMDAGMAVHPWSWVYFVSFVMIAAFVVINVLIGIVLNSMEEAREAERRSAVRERLGAERTSVVDPDASAPVVERIAILRAALDELEAELSAGPRGREQGRNDVRSRLGRSSSSSTSAASRPASTRTCSGSAERPWCASSSTRARRCRSSRGIAAIVAMGGPMSVNDEQEHPWLVAEKQLIRDGVGAGVPFFGACLGVQLLASSLGARVTTGGVPEVGVLPVFGTDAARDNPGLLRPCLAATDPPVAQRHVRAARGCDPSRDLARVPASGVPGRRARLRRAVPSRGHRRDHRRWARVPEYAVAADRALGAGGLERLLDDFRTSADEMRADARTLFSRWVDLWAAR